MPQGECIGNVKETKLSEIIGRIDDMSRSLSDARCDLNCLSDRLLGSTPETACETVNDPEREGVIGLLEDRVNNLKYQVAEMQDAVKRIVNSGVV